MPEQPETEGASAQQDSSGKGDQASTKGATAPKQTVDLEDAVTDAARKAERETQRRVSLDLFDNPEHRKIAERLQSQAVNDYRKSLEGGENPDFLKKADVERMLREERRLMKAEQEQREAHRELMAELGLRKGTEDYEQFSAAALQYLDKSKLGDRKAVELLAKALGVGVFKPKEEIPKGGTPFTSTAGVPIRPTEGGKPQSYTDPEMDAVMADYERAMRGRSR